MTKKAGNADGKHPGQIFPRCPQQNCNCRHIARVPTKPPVGASSEVPKLAQPGDTLGGSRQVSGNYLGTFLPTVRAVLNSFVILVWF